jgi:hypothetical protein
MNEFLPNRSKKNIRILYWVCGIFIFIGLIVSVGNPKGFFFAGFAFVLLMLGHFFTAPRKVFYGISKEGITFRAGKKFLEIPFGEIRSMEELKEIQAEAWMLNRKLKEESEEMNIVFGAGGVGMNPFDRIKEALKVQAKSFSPYKFLSVPIMYITSGRSRQTNEVNLPCDCVFIQLKSGDCYLVSPLDTAGFTNEATKYLSLQSPSVFRSSATDALPPDDSFSEKV